VFGDIDEAAGNAKVAELTARDQSVAGQLIFVPTDITNYDHVYRLFQVAYEAFGRVDIAANIAGLAEIAGWFDPPGTLESVKMVLYIPTDLRTEKSVR
jgi:NAD(P)-dependent dehydrogenase (short-subunit alcohol dehydrogenase family)